MSSTQMNGVDKTLLLFGPYQPPKVKPGGFLICKVRGSVQVGSWSNGPIPWPRAVDWGSYILCGDLVRALRREAAAAIVRHWGVSDAIVTTWRKQLGIGRSTPGTHRLASLNAKRIFTGRPKTEAFKQMMRKKALQRVRNGEIPFVHREQLWTKAELELVGKLPDEELATLLGRTVNSVKLKRTRMGIKTRFHKRHLRPEEIRLLGKYPDAELAAKLRRPIESIRYWRTKLKKPYTANQSRPWTRAELKLLGKIEDAQLAKQLNRTPKAVQSKRVKMGLKIRENELWTAAELALVGKLSDRKLAQKTGRSLVAVQQRRRLLAGSNSEVASKRRGKSCS